MLKVVMVGAGYHTLGMHAPSLARYAEEHPGELSLAAVCDLKEDLARRLADQFGVPRTYTDVDRMLEAERPDACWVVVPITATRQVAGQVMERGVPVIFEKPPGQNLREARELAAIAQRTGTPHQVAFNRRWAPCTQQALAWLREHGPFEYLHARMLRTRRLDEAFAFGTGIHLLDCVRALGECAGGVVAAHTVRTPSAAGVYNFCVDLQFRSGARGRCDILPTCGMLEEAYVLYGGVTSIVSALPWLGGGTTVDGKAERWVDGALVESATWSAEPAFLGTGFYQEAEAFLAALKAGRAPWPSAQEAVDSVVLAEAVQAGEDVTFP